MIYNDLMFLRTSATIMINGLERERERDREKVSESERYYQREGLTSNRG